VLRPQANAKAVPHFVRVPAACLNAARGVAAGYRGSGFVHWYRPEIRAAPATESGSEGEPDAPERHLGSRGDTQSNCGSCGPIAMQQTIG